MPLRSMTLLIALLIVCGCAKTPPAPVAAKPADVVVVHPVIEKVTRFEEFPGRTEAVKAVEIRGQVTGYLEKIHFIDGGEIKAGDKLFTIDSRIYRAECERARANVTQAEAKYDRLEKDYQRIKRLTEQNAGSLEELDRVTGEKAEAAAAIGIAKAALKMAETNLDYCTITTPITGRASRRMIDVGNLVRANESILTSVVATDPVYVYFEVDERTFLRLQRIAAEGSTPASGQPKVEVEIGLTDETDYPRRGTIDFTDNQVNPGTGTIRVRAVVPNPNKLLTPGLFCRLRLPIGAAHPAILIPEKAIGSDQGQKYVFVVNEKDEVELRPITLGFPVDRRRVIESGLSEKDRVITEGLQRVRPRVKVNPKLVPPAGPPKSPSPGTDRNPQATAGR